MSRFNQGLAQPSIPLTRLAAEVFASALVIARTDANPGGEMLGIGKARHIRADLRQEDLGESLIDPRNRIQERQGLSKGEGVDATGARLASSTGEEGGGAWRAVSSAGGSSRGAVAEVSAETEGGIDWAICRWISLSH